MVTAERPADHVWHLGGWFSFKYINGINYWEERNGKAEGLTDVLETRIETKPDFSAVIHQRIAYRPAGQEASVMQELRTIHVSAPSHTGRYTLDWDHQFTAISDLSLDRTPLANEKGGKSYGGYAGNSLRLGAGLKNWTWLDSKGRTNPSKIHGQRSAWVQTISKTNGAVAMIEHPENRGYPNAWYVAAGMPYFSSAFIFNKGMTMTKGESLRLRYRIALAEKPLDKAEIEAALKASAASRK